MKIQFRSLSFALIILLAVVAISYKVSNAQTLIDTTAATGISNTVDSAPQTNPAIRDRIRADLDSKIQNARMNQEYRNQMIEGGYRIASTSPRGPLQKPPMLQKIASTSSTTKFQNIKERMEDRKENRQERQDDRQDRREDRQDNREQMKEMALDNLKQRRDDVTKNLDVAIRNLTELRKRIQNRIEKDRNSGKDMTKVNELLKVADQKLATAKNAVDSIKSYKPENSAVSSTTQNCTSAPCPLPCLNKNNASSTDGQPKCIVPFKVVALGPIRDLVEKAQNAIKDAHKALNEVVVAIAKISGNPPRNDRPGTTTIPNQTPVVETTNQ